MERQMQAIPELGGFTAVDHTNDPGAFVKFLATVSTDAEVQRYKQRTFAILDPRDGNEIIDIGCGLGDDACELARHVGPTGRVIGVDSSAAMIAAARERQDASLPVEFFVGNAYALEFADSSFDRCRAERVFHHLTDPERGLAELVRVARTGGRVFVSEPDYGTFFVDAPDQALTRRILDVRCDMIASPWFARCLPRLLRGLGVTDVEVVAQVLVLPYTTANRMMGLETAVVAAVARGAISEDAGAGWLTQLAAADGNGDFFAGGTMFLVAGRKA
jgi:ubiquinone/menaquinone biosynthesis C-methylase UbiE